MKEKTTDIDILEEELRKDILYQIDMQLYDEFNDKFCEIEENLGTIYSYKDLEDLKKAESDTERTLLREAVSTLIAENKELKEENKKIKQEYINPNKARISYFDYKKRTNVVIEGFILKSKVEKEIDKLNKKEKDLQNSISDEEREEYSDASISFDLMDIDIRRNTLQSLLGKE